MVSENGHLTKGLTWPALLTLAFGTTRVAVFSKWEAIIIEYAEEE